MSMYDWPPGQGLPDDARARGAFLGAMRTDFDPEGASLAGRTPAKAPRQRGRPAAPASGRANLWTPLGPATIMNSRAAGKPRVTGRINAFGISDDGQRVYAGAAIGGVWYSSNAGASWRSLGGLAATRVNEISRPATRNAVGAIVVRPGGTEATDEIFVGTGEPYHYSQNRVGGRPGRSLGGIGILVAQGPAGSADADPWTREAPNLVGEAVNRIALQPGGSGVIAATTIGLLRRPDPVPAAGKWARVSASPLNGVTSECTDVLWTSGAGTRPERLWVWVRGGDHRGLWVQDGGAGDFRQVATAGAQPGRAVLAASTPPDQVWVFVDQGSGNNPLLFKVAAPGPALPVAAQVKNVPHILKDQGYYDIAMAVHPTKPDRVFLGGKWFYAQAPDNKQLAGKHDGAVVWADVTVNGTGDLSFGPPAPVVGAGMHADVHEIHFTAAGNRLWAACDGGMFRSDRPTEPIGFVPCNTGLGVAQSNYTFSHPSCEGFLVAGLQDNGVIQRLSSGVWKMVEGGDGGGVVLDPLNPERWLQQYIRGSWSASDGSITVGSPLHRIQGGRPRKLLSKDEDKKFSAFYSSAAGGAYVYFVAPQLPRNVGQVILGTNRLWYTDDFGGSWVTLPTGTDPLAAIPLSTSQDTVTDKILACRWQGPDVAWVLGENTLWRYARTPHTASPGKPGIWARVLVIRRGTDGKKDRKSATGPMRSAAMWTDLAVNEESPIRGTKGAVYLGTIGSADNNEIDTLWWFDGTSTWHPTRLRAAVPAPVTAIACDPAHPEEVWVGTTVGVWRGIRTLNGANPPTWRWETRVNGLPEAAVEDLSIFSDGSLRLLRAAIASRGLWELRLDVTDVADLTYLRAHTDDLRYRARAGELKRDNRTARSWHGSPDVRPRVASAPRPRPGNLPWQRGFFEDEGLRRFQSALRAST
ncbi:hypothetical protein, partial [Arthrobacter sp. Bi26]|uniref:hypothetical protein n=1 Tax=Arthrobacter sp. Bi26 TaxID=2822350 RepID=UPI001E60AA41